MCELAEAKTTDAELANVSVWTPTELAAVLLARRILRRALCFNYLRFFRHIVLSLLTERHAESGEQRFRLFVAISCCDDDDIEAVDLVDAIVVHFRENQLLAST